MSDIDTAPPAPAPHQAKKPRGRPPSKAPETPQERIKRLERELHHAQEAHRIEEQHKAGLVGTIALKHAHTDKDFRRAILSILHASINRPGDFKDKNDLTILRELTSELESTPHP